MKNYYSDMEEMRNACRISVGKISKKENSRNRGEGNIKLQ
jgi:hypothetical protein